MRQLKASFKGVRLRIGVAKQAKFDGFQLLTLRSAHGKLRDICHIRLITLRNFCFHSQFIERKTAEQRCARCNGFTQFHHALGNNAIIRCGNVGIT
ncbi:Uncharacterised protein [Vibrio cholerae]|nr:Uncharacterised protein [Vibrio cholerae]CSC59752.1 Uncharacterised protein [Vibrio cholerae]